MVWDILKGVLGKYHSVFFDTSAILSLAVLPEEAFKGQHKRLVAAQVLSFSPMCARAGASLMSRYG